MDVHASRLSLCLIDDCDGRDIPLIELQMSDIVASGRQTSRSQHLPDISGKVTATLSVDFFNTDLSAWAPVVEPWPVSAQLLTHRQDSADSNRQLKLSSDAGLDINVSRQMLVSVSKTITSWSDDYQKQDHYLTERRPFVPFRLINSTGVSVSVWRIGLGDVRSDPIAVAPEQEAV